MTNDHDTIEVRLSRLEEGAKEIAAALNKQAWMDGYTEGHEEGWRCGLKASGAHIHVPLVTEAMVDAGIAAYERATDGSTTPYRSTMRDVLEFAFAASPQLDADTVPAAVRADDPRLQPLSATPELRGIAQETFRHTMIAGYSSVSAIHGVVEAVIAHLNAQRGQP